MGDLLKVPSGKMGIGVISAGIRSLRDEYVQFAESDSIIHIHVDRQKQGAAYCRNEVLHSLYQSGCEHFFIFDDDVWPLRHDWQMRVVRMASSASVNALGNIHPFDTTPSGFDPDSGTLLYPGATTAFLYLTRHALETAGYFDEAFGSYGPEDCEYIYRLHALGLGGLRVAPELLALIHVEDFYACFQNSLFSPDEKAQGTKTGWDRLSRRIATGEIRFMPYPRESAAQPDSF